MSRKRHERKNSCVLRCAVRSVALFKQSFICLALDVLVLHRLGLLLQNAKGVFFMNKTLKLAFTALLTALAVVANIFTIPLTPTFSKVISFTVVFAFLAGIYLGIFPAFAVGFLGDLLAHFIHPLGAYNWFVSVASALTGVICALVYKLPVKNRLVKLLIASAICFVACSCTFNTFGLWLQIIVGVDPGPIGLIEFFKMDKTGIEKSFWVYLAGRVPVQLLNWLVNVVIIAAIQQSKVLDKLFAKIQLNSQQKKEAPAEK